MRVGSISMVFALAGALVAPVAADSLSLKTARGESLEVRVDMPAGPGPFPAAVLAPGQGYHMDLPVLAQTTQQLVQQGIAVYRFNWAYFTRQPKGQPSDDLSDELQDMLTVLNAAKTAARIDRAHVSVGGKSLGSLVAWRVLAADKSLLGGLFLTPVCSRIPKGSSLPLEQADENYPGIATAQRPMLFISGSRDPLCATPILYSFAAKAGASARVVVVGGDHGYEDRTLEGAAAERARHRNIKAAAQLAADFVAELAGL